MPTTNSGAMSSQEKLALLALLLLLLLGCLAPEARALESRSFRKEWKFAGNASVEYARNIVTDDNSFLYAVCTKQGQPVEMECNVTIATPILTWNESKSSKDTCKLRLVGTGEAASRREVTKLVSVDRFSKDKVIVQWWERRANSQYELEILRISVLRMGECEAVHLAYPVDVTGHVLLGNVILYPERFDLVLSSRAVCGTVGTCRLSHDATGRRLGEPAGFAAHLAEVRAVPVAPGRPDEGFFACGSDLVSWKFRAVHVTASGSATNLMTASVSDPKRLLSATSAALGNYGVCIATSERRVHCARFDPQGHVLVSATVKVPGGLHWMALHNLPDGGLLLLTGRCKEHKCRGFRVTRLLPDGHLAKAAEVPGLQLKCSDVPWHLTAEVAETDSEYRFFFACSHVHEAVGVGRARVNLALKFAVKSLPKDFLSD